MQMPSSDLWAQRAENMSTPAHARNARGWTNLRQVYRGENLALKRLRRSPATTYKTAVIKETIKLLRSHAKGVPRADGRILVAIMRLLTTLPPEAPDTEDQSRDLESKSKLRVPRRSGPIIFGSIRSRTDRDEIGPRQKPSI